MKYCNIAVMNRRLTIFALQATGNQTYNDYNLIAGLALVRVSNNLARISSLEYLGVLSK